MARVWPSSGFWRERERINTRFLSSHSHPRLAAGGPNNNDEIAVRSGDNEETMSGKDTEYLLSGEKEKQKRETSVRGREGASGSGKGWEKDDGVGDSWKDTGFRRLERAAKIDDSILLESVAAPVPFSRK